MPPRTYRADGSYPDPYAPPPRVYGTDDRNQNLSDFANQQSGEYSRSRATANAVSGQYYDALYNPTKTADMFGGYVKQQAQGITDPAMRDFSQTLDKSRASSAARFGGNGSTEEQRGVYNTSDLFSRNLSEALARLAPESAQLGLQYTGQLGAASNAANTNANTQAGLIFSSLTAEQQKDPFWQKLLGIAVGAGAGFLAGGPAGAVVGGVGAASKTLSGGEGNSPYG